MFDHWSVCLYIVAVSAGMLGTVWALGNRFDAVGAVVASPDPASPGGLPRSPFAFEVVACLLMAVEGWWGTVVARVGRPRAMVGLGAVLVIVAATIGFAAGVARERQATRDRHAATAAVLTGTVTWSNQLTRLMVFEQDGVVREPNQGDVVYYVIAETWRNADGKYFGGTYPECLASDDESGVSTDRHRVALTAIDWATGGVQDMHIAVQVHCLD